MTAGKRQQIHDRVFLWLLYAIAFFIPVWKVPVPWLIILMVLERILQGGAMRRFRNTWLNPKRRLLVGFTALYLFYTAGLAWTENFGYAADDLTVKLSLLLFPLAFAVTDWYVYSARQKWLTLKVFAAGCIAGAAVLLGRALWMKITLGHPTSFYYTNLSWNFHPGYLALYYAFAISNILYYLLIRKSVQGKSAVTGHLAILVFLTLMIVLLSSKAGLLAWFAVILIYTAVIILVQKKLIAGVLFIGVSVTIFGVLLALFPNAIGRVSQARQEITASKELPEEERSTGERMGVWKAAAKVIGRNFLIGTGTGDVKDTLLEQYRADHLDLVVKKRLNAHNQFIQTFATLGVTGLAVMLALLIIPAWQSLKKGRWIYLVLIVVTAVSWLFESMLETQAGVVFYAFFNAFLFAVYTSDSPGDPLQVGVGEG